MQKVVQFLGYLGLTGESNDVANIESELPVLVVVALANLAEKVDPLLEHWGTFEQPGVGNEKQDGSKRGQLVTGVSTEARQLHEPCDVSLPPIGLHLSQHSWFLALHSREFGSDVDPQLVLGLGNSFHSLQRVLLDHVFDVGDEQEPEEERFEQPELLISPLAPAGDFQVGQGLLELLLPQPDHRYLVLRLVEEAVDPGAFLLPDDVFLHYFTRVEFACPSKLQILVLGLDDTAEFSAW